MSTNATEGTILALLTHEDRIWSVDEVARELGDRLAVEDALASLHAAGLTHRLRGGFVRASRAELRAEQVRL